MSKTTRTIQGIGSAALALAAIGLFAVSPARADVTVSNRVVTTPRHEFTVDDIGLPAQLAIRVFTNDMPIAWRAEKEWPAAVIKKIGRGPQLAAPMRLEAVVDKVVVVAKADAPATLNKTDKGVEATVAWQADKLKGRLSIVYAEDGAITGQVTCNAGSVALDRLDLVMELDGLVDTVIAGNPAELAGKSRLPLEYGTLGSKPGVLWANGKKPAGDGQFLKDPVSHFFLGSGDRGFTWLAGEGLEIDPDEPSVSVTLDRANVVQWKMALVNKATRAGEKTATFTLLVHPARTKPLDGRLTQWQPWTGKAATVELKAAARGALAGSNVLVRADAGSVCETAASRAMLEGIAGGEAQSAAATLADRFPLGLFRYLAAPHTALSAQLRPNAAALTSAGAGAGPDRMALGRALLHDIGVDVGGLARRMETASILKALDDFGYFESDGKTEFLPYWRTAGIFQYGEAFEGDAGFAVTAENPIGRTKVSAYIRPTEVEYVKNQPVYRRKALFVLVNEGTNAVRDYLYVLNPNYMFGGYNRLQVEQIYSQLDFSGIPADSDWQRNRVERTLPELVKSRAGRATGLTKSNGAISRNHMNELMDVESGGIVRVAEREGGAKKYYGDAVKNGFQIYGPIYVPARGMRLLFGEGRVDLPHGVNGVVLDRKTGKPLSVPVHICRDATPGSTVETLKNEKKIIATVQSGKDGRFRYAGFTSGVILAEVDGKLFPTLPQMGIRNDGVTGGQDIPEPGSGEEFPWVKTSISQQWPNPNDDSAGKWVDVVIQAGEAKAL